MQFRRASSDDDIRNTITSEAPPQTLEHVWFGSASLGTVLVLPRLRRGVDVLKAVGKDLTQSQGIPAFKASRTSSVLAWLGWRSIGRRLRPDRDATQSG